jgi:hypothetical protein
MSALANPSKPDLGTIRAHLEQAARMGNEAARKSLEGPECPEELNYLVSWTYELYGRSGITSDFGSMIIAPLSHRELESWQRNTGNSLESWEVQAILELDAALRHPDLDTKTEGEENVPSGKSKEKTLPWKKSRSEEG